MPWILSDLRFFWKFFGMCFWMFSWMLFGMPFWMFFWMPFWMLLGELLLNWWSTGRPMFGELKSTSMLDRRSVLWFSLVRRFDVERRFDVADDDLECSPRLTAFSK